MVQHANRHEDEDLICSLSTHWCTTPVCWNYLVRYCELNIVLLLTFSSFTGSSSRWTNSGQQIVQSIDKLLLLEKQEVSAI